MKCLIIGSGCSALSCGIMLAQKGYQVTLFEQSSTLAPTLNGFTRGDRYYETGVHSLGGIENGQPLHNYFRFLGIHSDLQIELNTNPPFVFSSSNGKWSLPSGYLALEKSLHKKFPDEKQAISTFLQLIKRLSIDFQYGNSLADGDMHEAEKPLQQVLNSYFTSPKLMGQLTALLPLFCGLGTEESSLGFYASSIGTYFLSSGNIKGGGRALTKALYDRFISLGGVIFCKSLVTKIHLNELKACTGLSTSNGQLHSADIIIATCHPVHLTTLLPDNGLRQVRRKYYNSLQSSHSFVAIYGHLPRSIALPQSGIIGNQESPVLTMDSQGASQQSRPPIMFFCHHQNGKDRTQLTIIAPTSFQQWSGFSSATPFVRKDGYKAFKQKESQRILEKIGEFHPEIVQHIYVDSVSSPLTMRDYCNMPQGAIYGSKSTYSSHPPLPILPIKNLFLSGQALIGPGILGAMTSAAMTVENILLDPHFAKEIHSAA